MAVTRKKTTQKRQKAAISPDQMRSFRVYPSDEPFFVIRISHQTFYWLVIGLLVLALGTWTLLMTMRAHALYEQADTAIEADMAISQEIYR